MSLNSVTLLGRLTKVPDFRTTPNGTTVATFTLAVDRDYQSGGIEKQTDFIECAAWRKTAEFVSKYFKKGQMMALHGSLQTRKWEDKNGNARISWEVVATNVYFGGDKRAESAGVNVSANDFTELPDDEGGELPF